MKTLGSTVFGRAYIDTGLHSWIVVTVLALSLVGMSILSPFL